MSKENCDGNGRRLRVPFLGENAYLVGTRAIDGGIDFLAVVPHENRPENMRERMMVDAILQRASDLTREV